MLWPYCANAQYGQSLRCSHTHTHKGRFFFVKHSFSSGRTGSKRFWNRQMALRTLWVRPVRWCIIIINNQVRRKAGNHRPITMTIAIKCKAICQMYNQWYLLVFSFFFFTILFWPSNKSVLRPKASLNMTNLIITYPFDHSWGIKLPF